MTEEKWVLVANVQLKGVYGLVTENLINPAADRDVLFDFTHARFGEPGAENRGTEVMRREGFIGVYGKAGGPPVMAKPVHADGRPDPKRQAFVYPVPVA